MTTQTTTFATTLTPEMMKTATSIFLDMCSRRVSCKNAVTLTAERMGWGETMRNTLLGKFLGLTIEENLMQGMTVEPAIRDAFRKFEIENEGAVQALIRHHEIEMSRIHGVEKDELNGVGHVGGKMGLDGKPLGAIKIIGNDGESLTRDEIRPSKN